MDNFMHSVNVNFGLFTSSAFSNTFVMNRNEFLQDDSGLILYPATLTVTNLAARGFGNRLF